MVNVKRALKRILGASEDVLEDLERRYQEEKDKECVELHNAIQDVLVEHKASFQNVAFVFKLIEWGYLRAKYLELLEGTVQIPDGSIPIPKMKAKEAVEPVETEEAVEKNET